MAACALVAMLAVGLTASTTGSDHAKADPGNPGTPGAPKTLYTENFENGVGAAPVLLTDYNGAAPQNETYTADAAWLEGCNGAILDFSAPDAAQMDQAINNCAPNQADQAALDTDYDSLRQLANAMGQLNNSDPSTEHVVAAYTAGDPGPDKVEFATNQPVNLPSADGRFVTFGVDAAAENCNRSAPEYNFSLTSGGTSTPVGATINACTGGQTVTVPAVRDTPARTDVHVGHYTSNGSALLSGDSFGISMTNANGDGTGNDAAFDNIKVLDVTPQLDKSFSPASIETGQNSTLTFTITNTSDLAAKDGWSFTDTLPTGVVVANPAATATTCPAGVVTAAAGGTTVKGTGNLNAGQASCTVSVNVTSTTAGKYTNGPDNVDTIGLDKPGPAPLTVTDPPPWTCSPQGYLFQTPTGTDDHTITPINLVTGQPGTAIDSDRSVNGVGYNTKDNYMYGFGANQVGVVRIGSDGATTVLGKPAAGSGTDAQSLLNSADVGDFDKAGHLWALLSTSNTYEEIDLSDPTSPTYNTVIASGTIPRPAVGLPSDWAYINGAFYGVVAETTANGNPTHLVKFTPPSGGTAASAVDAGTLADTDGTAMGDPVTDGGAYGAAYADPAGNLYVGNNTTGEIYRVKVSDLSTIDLSTGPSSGGNDGARCADAPIPTITVTKTVAGRVQAADQFTVGLNGPGGATLATASTTGSDKSVSTTDYPVQPSTTYTVTDAMAANSPDALTSYDFTITCTNTTTGAAVGTTGAGPNWTVTSTANGDPISCTVTNSPATPKFSINKTSSATGPLHVGDTLTYTVTVRNTGRVPYTADNPAAFTDNLAKVTDDATYDDDGAASAGVVTYSASKLNWSGPLAVGATVTVTYSVTVTPTGDNSLDNAIPPPPGGCDPSCSTHNVKFHLKVEKKADTAQLIPGHKVTYTVTIMNDGKGDYTAADPATMSDDLSGLFDDSTYDNDQKATSGTVTYTEPNVAWSGPLAVGATVTITYSVTVNKPDTGDKIMKNTAVVPDSNCVEGSGDPACTPVVPGGSLKIKKTSSVQHAAPGQKVTYTVRVTNTGQTDFNPLVLTDDLSDVLDDATYDKDGSKGVSVKGGTLTMTGVLKVGTTATFTYSVTVNDPDKGNMVLKNVIPPPDVPGITTNCPSSDCGTTTPVGSYEVKKTSSKQTIHLGDTVGYTVTVTNTGKVAYTTSDPAKFTDDMSDVLDDATYNKDAKASAGSTSYSEPKLSWSGGLPVGGKVTVTYSITTDDPDHGDGKLLNVVTTPHYPTGDPANCTTGSTPAPECQTQAGIEAASANHSPQSGGTASTGNDTEAELLVALVALIAGAFACFAGMRRRRG